MHTILLNKCDEVYLEKCASELRFVYGIIIGQPVELQKYVVVHLAKNGEEDLPEAGDSVDAPAHVPQTVDDINTQALANQWISASKMIPGSFRVLGVFMTSDQQQAFSEEVFKSAKNVLYDIHNLLVQNSNLCATVEDAENAEYIFLAYSTAAKKATCKLYTHGSNGGTLTPMDCRFVEKPLEWLLVECSYEFNDLYPIVEDTPGFNVERQYQQAVGTVRKGLEASEVFIQNECVDDAMLLDLYLKNKNSQNQKNGVAPPTQIAEPLKATILTPIRKQFAEEPQLRVRQVSGVIRFKGIISSRIWCNPKSLLGNVKRFLRDDIARSLAARVQVYCDGLTDTNVSMDSMLISEPPRRVYFSLPSSPSSAPIQFSDYIFRGEAPTVAVAQAKQILDLDLNAEQILDDLEAVPDDEAFSIYMTESQEQKAAGTAQTKKNGLTQFYVLGIILSLIVLLVSVVLHSYVQ